MDVTPQLLKEVEFREKFRGYDPDEVDDFLERVGLAFTQVQDKVREANDQIEAANARAARAEARARDSSDIDDTLRRTLVLAQRTADAAIAEAREQAAGIVGEAQNQVRQQTSAAEERSAATTQAADEAARRKLELAESQSQQVLHEGRTSAEQTLSAAKEQANRLLMDARRLSEEIQAEARTSADIATETRRTELANEIEALTARRLQLKDDAEKLDGYLSSNRARVDAAATELRKLLDDPASLAPAKFPVLTASDPPAGEAPSQLLRTAPASAGAAEAQIVVETSRVDEQAVEEVLDTRLALDGAESADTSATGAFDPDRTAAYSIIGDADSAIDDTDTDTDDSVSVAGGDDDSANIDPRRSSWPAGGPPPPPPPPRQPSFVTSDTADSRPGPPPPPPPVSAAATVPLEAFETTAPSGDQSPTIGSDPFLPAAPAAPVAPWLSRMPGSAASTVPAPPAPPPPPAPSGPGRDSFLDELRRAVGEAPDGDGSEGASADSDDAATRFFEDRDPTDPAAKFLEPDGDSNRTWFGRKR